MKTTEKIVISLTIIYLQTSNAVKWDQVRCSVDRSRIEEGILSQDQIGRYPWLGVIQHDFYLHGTKRSFSVTGAVRIHASYAVASAEDMAMINRKTITNTTHFIVWHSAQLKYSIGVEDYIMHPEYEDRRTYATTALVELLIVESSQVGHPAPVLPICLPAKNHMPPLDKIFVVKMTAGDDGQLLKEVISMVAVDNKDCDKFYEKAELDFKMMMPTKPICAATVEQQPACIWDGGAALVTREPDNYWTLVGFGVRGPGCGAPARFVDIRSQLNWIDPQSPSDISELWRWSQISAHALYHLDNRGVVPIFLTTSTALIYLMATVLYESRPQRSVKIWTAFHL